MNKQELQDKLNALLVGQSTYNMYDLCRKVESKFDEWFDNSKGYFTGVGLSGYSMWIRYKDRGFATFEIKRKKVDNIYVVKEVIVSDNFVDTETSIRAIKERLKKEMSDKQERDWFSTINGFDINLCVKMLSVLKEQFGDKKAKELLIMLKTLTNYYWVVEEAISDATNL